MNDAENPLIHSVPYIRGVPEYAMQVRKKFRELHDRDFIVAIDLPHGLEPDVLKAVKRLPKITLIIDILKRGILVTPSCASTEAVRSFLDAGVDYHFIDASLPIRGSLDEWKKFIEFCQELGPSEVVTRAEEYGIDMNALLFGDAGREVVPEILFKHLGSKIGGEEYAMLIPAMMTRYMEARRQYMALRLQELLRHDLDILFVCGMRNWRRVMELLRTPGEPFDDSFLVPIRTCRVAEADLIKVSAEIPYFSFLYEQWRDDEFLREAAIRELLTLDPPVPSVNVREVYRYAGKLGLSDGQIYPDLFNILSAAKYGGTDHYAYNVLKKACSYPYADRESNCVIEPVFDYDFSPQSVRILTIKADDEDNDDDDGESGPPERHPPAPDMFSFSRTKTSLQDESEFMRYLMSRYQVPVPGDEYVAEEFVSGMKEGIDVRTSLRYHNLNKIFVKERLFLNGATYVVDFGGKPDWRAYFDTQYPIVGAARHGTDREEWITFTAFARPPDQMQNLLQYIDLAQPLISCIDLALRYAKSVFVFTSNADIATYYHDKMNQVQVIDPERIPKPLMEGMRCFYLRK